MIPGTQRTLPPVDPLALATARAVLVLLRRDLADAESVARSYGDHAGTLPRDLTEATARLESALRLAGEVP